VEGDAVEAVAGEKFDMKLNQLAERVPSETVAEGTIIAAVERGWKMDNEVVRLAKCTVSDGPEAVEEPPAEEAAAEGAAEEASE